MPVDLFVALLRTFEPTACPMPRFFRGRICMRLRPFATALSQAPRYSSEDHPGSLARDQIARRGPCLYPILALGVIHPARTMARTNGHLPTHWNPARAGG